jgi:ribonuclease HI
MTRTAGWLFCDGGARGNPGPAGAGAVLYDGSGQVVAEKGEYLGHATNNTAEYRGVLLGLELARRHHIQDVRLRLDSELIVRQLTGEYRVKHPDLRRLHAEVKRHLAVFAAWSVEHVPREENSAADKLVNEAIDSRAEER